MHLEVALLPASAARPEAVREAVLKLLPALGSTQLCEGQEIDFSSIPQLSQHVRHIRVTDVEEAAASTEGVEVHIHVHQLYEDEVAEEGTGDGEGGDEAVAFQLWTLPAAEFDGVWESLVYDDEVKPRLLRYVGTAMRFSELGVDPRVIAWNRVVLLHGPPGTGKTSLCRGLAQKLAVRLSSSYPIGHLVEVNAHSLFSKWFSESGKMVMGMFAKIREILDDADAFVVVLIDEVESLTAARKAAVSGSEPSDAVRVVNALLTQLDGLKRYKNALILTTSNITDAIDAAFIDRADIKQYIGPPGAAARYDILASCVCELRRVGAIAPFEPLLPIGALKPHLPSPPPTLERVLKLGAEACAPEGGGISPSLLNSSALYALATACDGLSGRALRKMPFLAQALFVPSAGPVALDAYLTAMQQTIQFELGARKVLDN